MERIAIAPIHPAKITEVSRLAIAFIIKTTDETNYLLHLCSSVYICGYIYNTPTGLNLLLINSIISVMGVCFSRALIHVDAHQGCGAGGARRGPAARGE